MDSNASSSSSSPKPLRRVMQRMAQSAALSQRGSNPQGHLLGLPFAREGALKLEPVATSTALALHPEAQGEKQSATVVARRLAGLAGHMAHQEGQHHQAQRNTKALFNQLLDDVPFFCQQFGEALQEFEVKEPQRIYHEVDPDRSVAVLNVLWHSLSFTTRGNNKPLALLRQGRGPLFTGRILAIRGDYHDLSHRYETGNFTDLLPFELASLYVPADPLEPAIMKAPHLGQEEFAISQNEAGRFFLLRTLEMVCSGGFLHEQAL